VKLNIVSDISQKEFNGEEMTISISLLSQKATHLFVASHLWDELYCEVDDSIPLNCLKYMVTKAKKVTVKLPEKCTVTTMRLLTELYPVKAGTIRKAFMSGKNLQEVIM
jgi:hypothetical protein